MGYTHYWTRHREVPVPAEAFGRFAMDAKAVVTAAGNRGIEIAGWDGEGEPEFTEGYVRLNGRGEDAHETFVWHAECPENPSYRADDPDFWDFTKTARKPYDAVVCALLLRLKHYYGDYVSVESDGLWDDPGGWGEWVEGRALYSEVFGEDAECPFDRAEV